MKTILFTIAFTLSTPSVFAVRGNEVTGQITSYDGKKFTVKTKSGKRISLAYEDAGLERDTELKDMVNKEVSFQVTDDVYQKWGTRP